jgi:glutamyl-tRNA reductase
MTTSAILTTIVLTGIQLVQMSSRRPRAAAVAAASAISRQSTQPFYNDLQRDDAEESVASRRSQRERIAAEHHDPMAGITAEKQVS